MVSSSTAVYKYSPFPLPSAIAPAAADVEGARDDEEAERGRRALAGGVTV